MRMCLVYDPLVYDLDPLADNSQQKYRNFIYRFAEFCNYFELFKQLKEHEIAAKIC